MLPQSHPPPDFLVLLSQCGGKSRSWRGCDQSCPASCLTSPEGRVAADDGCWCGGSKRSTPSRSSCCVAGRDHCSATCLADSVSCWSGQSWDNECDEGEEEKTHGCGTVECRRILWWLVAVCAESTCLLKMSLRLTIVRRPGVLL